MQHMVVYFASELDCKSCKIHTRAGAQSPKNHFFGMVEKKVADKRLFVVDSRILHQMATVELACIAHKRNSIRVAFTQLLEHGVEHSALSHLILRYRCKADIFLQKRTKAYPFTISVTINKLIIS